MKISPITSINTTNINRQKFGSITYKKGWGVPNEVSDIVRRDIRKQPNIYRTESPHIGLRGLLAMGLDRASTHEEDYPVKVTIKADNTVTLEMPSIDFILYRGEEPPRTSAEQKPYIFPWEKDDRPVYVPDEDGDYFTVQFDKPHPYKIQYSLDEQDGLNKALTRFNHRQFDYNDNKIIVDWLKKYNY